MKKYISIPAFIISFTILVSCQNTKPVGDDKNKSDPAFSQLDSNYEDYSFEFNNKDVGFFGKEYFVNDLPISPSSIALINDNIYFADPYHNNIKQFNLKTKNLLSSKPVAVDRQWLYDIIGFNDKVYASSLNDTLYVFTQELELVERYFINEGGGHFFKVFMDSVILGYPSDNHKYITLNKQNEIINVASGYRDKSNLVHGKFISRKNNSSHIDIEYGKLDLKTNYQFEGINLDYDGSRLAYFNTDSNSLHLYVYSYRMK